MDPSNCDLDNLEDLPPTWSHTLMIYHYGGQLQVATCKVVLVRTSIADVLSSPWTEYNHDCRVRHTLLDTHPPPQPILLT